MREIKNTCNNCRYCEHREKDFYCILKRRVVVKSDYCDMYRAITREAGCWSCNHSILDHDEYYRCPNQDSLVPDNGLCDKYINDPFVHQGRRSNSIKVVVDPGMKDETVAILTNGKEIIKIINLAKENTMTEVICSKCTHRHSTGMCTMNAMPLKNTCVSFSSGDTINHPSHYNQGKIEVIEFIEDQKMNYHLGNAMKYICRAGKKNPEKTTEDLKKAIWYIQRYLETVSDTPKRPNDMEEVK